MKVLIRDTWHADYLDPWCGPEDRRVTVARWVVVEELRDLYVQSPYDLRRLIDYGRELGPVEVARKVVSRLSERRRDDKVAACGLGVDCETGEPVAFFAPCAPRAAERVVVPKELVWHHEHDVTPLEISTALSTKFAPWVGWTRVSGHELTDVADLQELVKRTISKASDRHMLEPSAIRERRSQPVEGSRLRAALFGYGHYARSIVLPSLPPEIEVVCVHEIDPLLVPDGFPTLDTSPHLREGESADVTLVAGFHHTHATLAASALRRGSAVVSEKPLATTQTGLDELLAAWDETSNYFAGFQRRYLPANEWVREDLLGDSSDPMSYHALVHEVSLPERHWYHWPSSGSRLLSNGCHWIDHFLWLNDFAAVSSAAAWFGGQGELRAELTLETGAYFTLTLTDRGSDRLGVREHTEIHVRDHTATITDGSSYVCEGPRSIVRDESWHRLKPHHSMYANFAQRLLDRSPGDSRESTRLSAQTVLDLEEILQHS